MYSMFGCARMADGLTISCAVMTEAESSLVAVAASRILFIGPRGYAATIKSTDVSAETATSVQPTFFKRAAGGGNAASAHTNAIPGTVAETAPHVTTPSDAATSATSAPMPAVTTAAA